MTKRRKRIGQNKIAHSHKTKKRLAIKRLMLQAKASKRKQK